MGNFDRALELLRKYDTLKQELEDLEVQIAKEASAGNVVFAGHESAKPQPIGKKKASKANGTRRIDPKFRTGPFPDPDRPRTSKLMIEWEEKVLDAITKAEKPISVGEVARAAFGANSATNRHNASQALQNLKAQDLGYITYKDGKHRWWHKPVDPEKPFKIKVYDEVKARKKASVHDMAQTLVGATDAKSRLRVASALHQLFKDGQVKPAVALGDGVWTIS